MSVEIELVQVEMGEDTNVILGQSHFIKTVEDVYEAMVNTVPGVKFGIAFCEASGDRKIRFDGTDEEMQRLAVENARKIGAGHSFVLFMKGAYPINFLRHIRQVPEIVGLYAATANPLQVVVAKSSQGRGILGVIDGEPPLGVENDDDKEWRRDFLRKIGYKK
ncbi:MAG: adenosine-specific kinase [Candidatus Thermoplasmatota archaeon]|nr:adenosine-specific kinase [Candidatus Thermoplasmatota archaeon]